MRFEPGLPQNPVVIKVMKQTLEEQSPQEQERAWQAFVAEAKGILRCELGDVPGVARLIAWRRATARSKRHVMVLEDAGR